MTGKELREKTETASIEWHPLVTKAEACIYSALHGPPIEFLEKQIELMMCEASSPVKDQYALNRMWHIGDKALATLKEARQV